VIAVIATLALAAAPLGPTALVKSIDAEVQQVIKTPDASAKKLAQRIDEVIDFNEMSKRAMGANWAKLNKKQQDELGTTMRGLLKASYENKAMKDKDGKQAPTVEYGEESVNGNEAVVNTSLKVKPDTFAIVYKLYRADPKASWRVYDVVTDEVSLVTTYQDQFKKQMADKGFDGLLTTLNTRRESLEKQNTELSEKKN
jgi:phospholipid transport system substrate-binding protein